MAEEGIRQLFGLKLKNYRKQLGYTQEKFCDLIGSDLSGYNKIENGKAYPSFETLCKILKVIKHEPNQMFDFIQYDTNDEILVEKIVLEKIKTLSSAQMKKLSQLLDVL